MRTRKHTQVTICSLLLLGAAVLSAGCGGTPTPKPVQEPPAATGNSGGESPANRTPATDPGDPASALANPKSSASGEKTPAIIAANPLAIDVLVNKRIRLPDGFRPDDLVAPQVPFIFQEESEKRLMRQEAARALELMFEAAEQDGILLAGVSGFRSYETQASLFAYYVQTQGEDLARRYSAEPGHSEHQTGLAMDVSGIDGKCAADDCFAGTPEAEWLQSHAPEYGFIIRYPKGKEAVTGYAYEPWHLRYVGVDVAKALVSSGLTADEFLAQTP